MYIQALSNLKLANGAFLKANTIYSMPDADAEALLKDPYLKLHLKKLPSSEEIKKQAKEFSLPKKSPFKKEGNK